MTVNVEHFEDAYWKIKEGLYDLTYETSLFDILCVAGTNLVLTARSGRHALTHRLENLGVALAADEVDGVWERFTRLADTKREVTDSDLRELVR